MEHDSTVTLSGFCEHITSKTQSEVYRLAGTAGLKIQDGAKTSHSFKKLMAIFNFGLSLSLKQILLLKVQAQT